MSPRGDQREPVLWSKEFLEAGKQRLAGDTARQATSPEVRELRSESAALKEVLADLTLENRLLKKSMLGEPGSFKAEGLTRAQLRQAVIHTRQKLDTSERRTCARRCKIEPALSSAANE